MLQYIARRVLLTIPILLGVTMVTFTLIHLLPGDPARQLAGTYATPEQVEAVRERLGLDEPLPVQYVRYLGRLVQGDLGQSLSSRQSVSKELLDYLPATLELTLAAMSITMAVAIPLGILAAVAESRLVTSLILSFSFIGVGLPEFWSGLIFQVLFFGKLGVLPLSGRLSRGLSTPPPVTHLYVVDALLAGQWVILGDALKHLALPAFTLAISRVASLARITHASMVEVMRNSYIRTARGKGLSELVVVTRHALKNALLPIVTVLAMQIGWLLGGAVLVENIFSWGGIGTYIWIGIFQIDIPVIMSVTILVTVGFVMLNLLADIVYRYLDPRITYD